MIPAGVSWVLTLGQRKGSVMKVNVGSTDRIIRLVAAAAAIVLAFLIGPTSVGGIILIVVGLVLAVTGLVGSARSTRCSAWTPAAGTPSRAERFEVGVGARCRPAQPAAGRGR